ncbi:hypothetical protein PsYK624_069820 [Phanerochaete sordida]|uniref:Uncharacterized protein n=1 Tax=Phanerochaete sordida TaxID=48140 RepID=A0A9P3LDX2_9APHY|nr:hypothetical protein PsYK624_069820 [Phanerochaete sordida]
MTSTQRYTSDYATGTAVPDRQHRSSRRADTSGNTLAFESAPSANKLSAPREQSYARGPPHYMASEPQAQGAAGFAAAAGVASSSRSRAHDQGPDPDIYAYAKRRTDRQSPRSSQEKILGVDQGQTSRASQQARGGYQTATPVQPSGTAYAASAQYQPSRDPTSSRHRKDRDRDRDEDRERRRERHREKERLREEEERLRERAAAAAEKELEKQRRREERRAEREKEKERERRREEKEQERARRHREKVKEYESRARDDSRSMNPVYPSAPLLGAKYQTSTEQVPSSSSNIALPSTQHALPSGTRPQATSDPRRDNVPFAPNAPPHVPEKERKARRTHRDKVLAQQLAQDSGLSSSEQEQARDRLATSRRQVPRDAYGDAQYSGPSGSENERGPGHERRRRKTSIHDPLATLRQHSTGAQVNANVPSFAQHNAPGPADEVPIARTKTPFAPGQSRTRDVAPVSMQAQPSAQSGQPSFQDLNPQSQQRILHHRNSQNSMNRGYSTGQAPHTAYPTQSNATPYIPAAQGIPGYQLPMHRDTALGVEGIYPSSAYPPNAAIPPTTATPPSMTVPAPFPNAPSRPSPAHAPPSLPPKTSHGTPPTKTADTQVHATGHHASISVYHPLQHKASAEFFVPGTQQPQTQSVTVNSTTVKDLAAKFPLNEDVLTSASSSTLNGGTNRSDQGPAAAAQYPFGGHAIAQSNAVRDPAPQIWLPPESQNTTASHRHNAQAENDIPIPIPYPKTGYMPPSAVPSAATRPQATPLQPKTPIAPPHVPSYAAPHSANTGSKATPAPGTYNPASYSPLQNLQQPPQRSPSTLNGIPLTSGGTPKQSSSMRLKTRNGSTDTVVYPGAKASPSHSARHITHRTSNGTLQASSRPDTNSSRPQPPPHEYPDTSRYRPQPSGYPAPNAPANYPPHILNQSYDSYPQPTTHMGHTRSASQPAVQTPALDNHNHAPRRDTFPAAVPPSTAPAPSASATIAAAYRSGAYGPDTSVRSQQLPEKVEKRIPPRAAPSPAPAYPAPPQFPLPSSMLAKTGYAIPNNAPPPARAPPPMAPSAGRANASATANAGHSRTNSEPPQMPMAGRVAISGHPSTPAPSKAQQLTSPSEEQLLMTPSSLAAPSLMLKGGNSTQPFPSARSASQQPVKPTSTKEKESSRKKGGLFGMFRSRSTPAAHDARVADALAEPPQAKPRQRTRSQNTINAVAASVRNIIAPHPQPRATVPPQATPEPPASSTPRTSGERTRARAGNDSESVKSRNRREPSPPATLSAPRTMRVASEQPAPAGLSAKPFTPFKLVSARRYRTVSAASNEADHGTQATSTIIGAESARSSTAGRLSPPLPQRDPKSATQVWINQEEAGLQDRGTWRRRRPGVVFDVSEDFTDTETHPSRKSSRRPS